MMPTLTEVSLSGTAVTDMGVAQLAKQWPHKPMSAKEKNVRGVNEITFGSALSLSNTSVTGKFLTNWNGNFPQQLNLSGTRVDDTFVDLLPDVYSGTLLDLSNTKITDEILPKLAMSNFKLVFIANTGLTAKAIIQAERKAAKVGLNAGVQSWYVTPGQVQGWELKVALSS